MKIKLTSYYVAQISSNLVGAVDITSTSSNSAQQLCMNVFRRTITIEWSFFSPTKAYLYFLMKSGKHVNAEQRGVPRILTTIPFVPDIETLLDFAYRFNCPSRI